MLLALKQRLDLMDKLIILYKGLQQVKDFWDDGWLLPSVFTNHNGKSLKLLGR
jgi:hypothetical protein